jgi:hypothetical protein
MKSYVGTAGLMLDFSLAAGLAPIESSFSSMVFSDATILLVAMAGDIRALVPENGYCSQL